MKRCSSIASFILFLILLSFATEVYSATAAEIIKARKIINQVFYESTAYKISNIKISRPDLEINLQNGTFYRFQPFTIDSVEYYYGGFFVGEGELLFHPTPSLEKFQLQRFFDSDSLLRKITHIQLFCDQEQIDQIISNGTSIVSEPGGRAVGLKNDAQDILTDKVSKDYMMGIFQNIVFPKDSNFILANTLLKDGGTVIYHFDPYEREEIKFRKRYDRTHFSWWLETVCSYTPREDLDIWAINGENKDQIITKHYEIDSEIDNKGIYSGLATIKFDVVYDNVQLLNIDFHSELKLDSILDSTGQKISSFRLKVMDKELWGDFWLIFDRPLIEGEQISLDFYSHGPIAEREFGEFYVSAGISWFPTYGFGQATTFGLKFRTPKDFGFAATGTRLKNEKIKDTLFTEYVISTPTRHASFSIGTFKEYNFEAEDVIPVDVLFSKSLHKQVGRLLAKDLVAIGKHMERQVGEDVQNSVRLFQNLFGPCAQERITVTEIMASHGQAYPGFLQLSFNTWINTDSWGNESMFRAHEAAHQWWGIGVDNETYHDTWLSEGFAEYSSLMYLQATKGRDSFESKLKEYRKSIMSARKFLFGSGKESGAIIQGYRTSSTETRGDYGLIIYQKGAYVLHMLRNLLLDLNTMKEDSFFGLMKEFYTTYKGRKASTKDFMYMTEKYTGMQMDWFFDQWVFGNQIPKYKFSYELSQADDGNYIADCKIKRSNVDTDFVMLVPVEIEFQNGGKFYMRLLIDKDEQNITLPPLATKPKKIRFNPFQSVLAEIDQ